jgi:hypothetical protein
MDKAGRKKSGLSGANPPETLAKRSQRGGDISGDANGSVAAYIADLSAQLESMALAAGHDLAAYFLRMARSECEARAREAAAQTTPPPDVEPTSEGDGQSPFDSGPAKR